MITINYCPFGQCVSDFEFDVYTNLIKRKIHLKTDFMIEVSNSVLITAIRLEIAKGYIDRENIQFKFLDKTFQANKYGAILDWPNGFCDIETYMCEQILWSAMKRRKEEKN